MTNITYYIYNIYYVGTRIYKYVVHKFRTCPGIFAMIYQQIPIRVAQHRKLFAHRIVDGPINLKEKENISL